MSFEDLERIRKFAESLRQATHDKFHEQSDGVKISHYWDTDCLYVPVRGFLAFQERAPEGRHDGLAQSLFSAGFLGPVALTTAHRLEFLTLVGRWPEQDRQSGVRYYEAAELFVSRLDVQSLDELTEAVMTIADPSDVAAALRRLASVDRDFFVSLESLAGTWTQRLRRLLSGDHIRMESQGPSLDEVTADHRYQQFADTLFQTRLRQGRRFNTYIDAAALTAIAILNERASRGKSRDYVRFFSSSNTIKSAYAASSWFRDQFSFIERDTGAVGSTWRTSYYYMLRAMFPVLSLGSNPVREDATRTYSLEELHLLSMHLEGASNDGDLMQISEHFVFENGERLSDLLTEIESFGMVHLWMNYDLSDLALRLVDGVDSIKRLQEQDSVQSLVDDLVQDAESRMTSYLPEVLLGIQVLQPLSSKLWKTGVNRDISLTHELGAFRWGLEFVGERDRVPLRGVTSDSAHLKFLAGLSLSNFANSETLEWFLAILLGFDLFECFEELLVLVGRHVNSDKLSNRMRLMTLAAQAKRPLGKIELVDGLVSDARAFWEELSAAEKTSFSLGYGFVLFSCWEQRRSLDGDHIFSSLLAGESLSVVVDRLAVVPAQFRSFYVNHIVYVGTVAGLGFPELPIYAEELERYCRSTSHTRFMDTVAYRRYIVAAGLISTTESGTWKLEHCSLLDDAIQILERAQRLSPTDLDVAQHLSTVRSFYALNGCAAIVDE